MPFSEYPDDYVAALEQKVIDAEARAAEMRKAIREFLRIGKRDLSNPKYDGYWKALTDVS